MFGELLSTRLQSIIMQRRCICHLSLVQAIVRNRFSYRNTQGYRFSHSEAGSISDNSCYVSVSISVNERAKADWTGSSTSLHKTFSNQIQIMINFYPLSKSLHTSSERCSSYAHQAQGVQPTKEIYMLFFVPIKSANCLNLGESVHFCSVVHKSCSLVWSI